MLCVSLQNNLSPKNYSHNLMLSLDMLYKEVRYYTLQVIVICCPRQYMWVMFFLLPSSLSVCLGAKAVG